MIIVTKEALESVPWGVKLFSALCVVAMAAVLIRMLWTFKSDFK